MNSDYFKNVDFEIEEIGGLKLEEGIYICQVKGVVEVPEKEYFKVAFDITEGKFKDYYTEAYKSSTFKNKTYGGYKYVSYKDSAQRFFGQWIACLQNSNQGYNFKLKDYDPQTWIGLKFVGIFTEEEWEYEGKSGYKVKLSSTRSTKALAEGKVKLPTAPKKVEKKVEEKILDDPFKDLIPFEEISDSDLPFS